MEITLEQQIIELLAKIQQRFDDEKKALELKRQEVQALMKDKVLLQDYEARLKEKEADLLKRELDLKKEKELSRQKTEMLALREKRIEDEKIRLQNIMNNI